MFGYLFTHFERRTVSQELICHDPGAPVAKPIMSDVLGMLAHIASRRRSCDQSHIDLEQPVLAYALERSQAAGISTPADHRDLPHSCL
jgi:hypothetical protein